MIKIQEPGRPWEIVHMDWVTGLPPGGDRSYNAFLVIVDRFSKTPIFIPCHKDDTAIVRFVYETLDNSNNIKSTMTVLSRKI
ncbi:hypothetical protein O181_121001 [Austropuccinia psidii MF-1]|uniref:Integrase catalytic domain-containing protein n=1 Tax=Austropuccinia psidii MF-1 TaxID=1389203 RepID=A0A9Q3Q127_9BASI|nr:hypothetical protein [Austropuccinia psidii MF-1]